MNSVTDNPLIFPEEGDVVSGGNFHGEPMALAADVLALGVLDEPRRMEELDERKPQHDDGPDRKARDDGRPQAPLVHPVVLTRR